MGRQIKHYDNDGATQLPASKVLAAVLAGTSNTPRKFGLKNSGSVTLAQLFAEILQVGLNTGYTHVRIGKDTRTLSPPWLVVAALNAPASSGVWSGTGSRFWVLTSVSASGESVISDEVTVNVDDISKSVHLTWQSDPNIRTTAQRLYRSTTSGSYVTPALVAQVGPAVESYDDVGAAAGAGAPPAENLTDGGSPNYGVAPSVGVADILFGDVEKGQWVFWWAQLVVPVGADDEENPFLSFVHFEEA